MLVHFLSLCPIYILKLWVTCVYIFGIQMCMFVCMYVHILAESLPYFQFEVARNTFIHSCVYVYVYMYVCIYVYMYICMYVCMYICIYVCTLVQSVPDLQCHFLSDAYVYSCIYICML